MTGATPGALVLRDWRAAGGGLTLGSAAGRSVGSDSCRWDMRVEGGVIVALGPVGSPPATPAAVQVVALEVSPEDVVLDLGGAFLAPGLVDAHVHLGIGHPPRALADLAGILIEGVGPRSVDLDAVVAAHPADDAERAGLRRLEANAWATLAAGVTAVRNLGNIFAADAQRRVRALADVGAGLERDPGTAVSACRTHRWWSRPAGL